MKKDMNGANHAGILLTSCGVAALLFLCTTTAASGQFRLSYDAAPAASSVEADSEGEDPIPDNDSTVGVQGGRYGIGLGSAWPAYGISGTLQVSETITAEAVLGLFGDVSNVGGRLWYRFNRNEKYDLYGYGAVGIYTYRGFDPFFFDDRVSETVLGIGAGAGIEAGLPALFDDEEFPPLFVNAELGLAFGSFDYYGGFSSIALGLGIHYRFGVKN